MIEVSLLMKIGATAAFIAVPALLGYWRERRGTRIEAVLLYVAGYSLSAAYFCGVGGAVLWLWGVQ